MTLICYRRESKLQCKGYARVKAMLLYFEETNSVCLFVWCYLERWSVTHLLSFGKPSI